MNGLKTFSVLIDSDKDFFGKMTRTMSFSTVISTKTNSFSSCSVTWALVATSASLSKTWVSSSLARKSCTRIWSQWPKTRKLVRSSPVPWSSGWTATLPTPGQRPLLTATHRSSSTCWWIHLTGTPRSSLTSGAENGDWVMSLICWT